jgi:hypothetical protein
MQPPRAAFIKSSNPHRYLDADDLARNLPPDVVMAGSARRC